MGNGPNDLSGGKATFNLSLSTPLNRFEFFTTGMHFFNNKIPKTCFKWLLCQHCAEL